MAILAASGTLLYGMAAVPCEKCNHFQQDSEKTRKIRQKKKIQREEKKLFQPQQRCDFYFFLMLFSKGRGKAEELQVFFLFFLPGLFYLLSTEVLQS